MLETLANGGDGGEGVLCVVRAAQRTDAIEISQLHGKAGAVGTDERRLQHGIAGRELMLGAQGTGRALRHAALQDRAASIVIDADAGDVRAHDEAFLDGCVIFDCAVPVEVVGRDVQEHADGGFECRRQVDLERREFDDMETVRRRRLEGQDGAADVAAHLHVLAGMAKNVGDERRRRRFAVGAGDGDEGRLGTMRGTLAREDLDVADDLDASRLGHADRPMRFGMGEGHAGRQDEARECRPIGLGEVDERHAGLLGSRPPGLAVIPGGDDRAALLQRPHGGGAGGPEPEDGDFFPGKGRGANHGVESSLVRTRLQGAQSCRSSAH